MTKTRNLNKEYVNWLSGLFQSKYFNDQKETKIVNDYKIDDLLYFITVRYDKSNHSKITSPQNFINSLNTEFNNIHKIICDEIIKGNYVRKPFLQPFSVAYIDVGGTRLKQQTDYFSIFNNPHHHVIFYIHPETKEKWDLINNPSFWNRLCRSSKLTSQIHIEKITEIDGAIDYSMKYLKGQNNNIQLRDQLEFICPDICSKKLTKIIYGASEFSNLERKEVI